MTYFVDIISYRLTCLVIIVDLPEFIPVEGKILLEMVYQHNLYKTFFPLVTTPKNLNIRVYCGAVFNYIHQTTWQFLFLMPLFQWLCIAWTNLHLRQLIQVQQSWLSITCNPAVIFKSKGAASLQGHQQPARISMWKTHKKSQLQVNQNWVLNQTFLCTVVYIYSFQS